MRLRSESQRADWRSTGLGATIHGDASTYSIEGPYGVRRMVRMYLAYPGFRAVVLYRFGHSMRIRGRRRIAALIERYMRRSCDCSISTAAVIGDRFQIAHVGAIVVGSRVVMGDDCSIRQGVTIGGDGGRSTTDGRSQPLLGSRVTVGAGAVIVGPIEIGDDVVIGANAVVRRSVPPRSRVLPPPSTVKDDAVE